ncbi:unnamed protein product, partial [Symbiodinium pilosum]
ATLTWLQHFWAKVQLQASTTRDFSKDLGEIQGFNPLRKGILDKAASAFQTAVGLMRTVLLYPLTDQNEAQELDNANRLLQQTAANLQEKKGRCKALMSSAAFMQLKLRHFCVQMLVQAPHDLGGLELFFRAAEKAPAGGDEVIAFLVDTDSELNFLMSKYCSGDDLSSAISVFQCLLSKAHLSAAGRIKRRVLVDPAWQRLSVARLVESVARSPQSARWCGCVICLELNCDGSALRRVVGVLMAWPLRGSPAPSESIRNFSIGAKN